MSNLTVQAPLEEPARQEYFMEMAKKQVTQLSRELGRPLTCCINTFGCQMNARDSEKLLGILEKIGYQETTDEHADFVLYNTCTVRENANLRVYGRLGYLNTMKKKNPHMMIALCGCMMQEPEVVEKIKKSYRFVDIIFGTHNIFKLAELLCMRFEEKKWWWISGKIRTVSWKICRQSGNTASNLASTSCLAATISAATVSCLM